MERLLTSTLTLGLLTAALCPLGASARQARLPNQFDGAWSITAVTEAGPCSASKTYRVQIRDGEPSVPGEEVGIQGNVSSAGAVQATITQGSNQVPITGSLDPKGSGSGQGTWRTTGGLVTCSGSWSARRAG